VRVMFAEEIIIEIDTTLERLIQNAESINGIDLHDLSDAEIDAFQKTQESLLNHLMNMDCVLETKRKLLSVKNEKHEIYKIQKKQQQFKKLTSSINRNIERAEKKLPIFSKRRSKRLI
jgi:hypothetical protein